MANDDERTEAGFTKFEARQPRLELRLKIQLGPVGIVYPANHSAIYFDLSRHGLIHIGRLWVDW